MADVKDFFNILFFIVMGVLAVLSYLQARKTLFSPIRTEVFKIQIAEIQNVLAFFNKQNSVDFDRDFDFKEIFNLNSYRMHSAYIKTFFGDKLRPSEEAEKYYREISYGAIVSEKHIQLIVAGSELEDKVSEEKELNAAMQLAKWSEFELPGVEYTVKFQEKMDELLKLAASPLLPAALTSLIYEFRRVIHDNLCLIGKVLDECSKEMPSKYSTPQDNVKFRPDWIWNVYVGKRESTEVVSEKILKFINSHLKINEIMK